MTTVFIATFPGRLKAENAPLRGYEGGHLQGTRGFASTPSRVGGDEIRSMAGGNRVDSRRLSFIL